MARKKCCVAVCHQCQQFSKRRKHCIVDQILSAILSSFNFVQQQLILNINSLSAVLWFLLTLLIFGCKHLLVVVTCDKAASMWRFSFRTLGGARLTCDDFNCIFLCSVLIDSFIFATLLHPSMIKSLHSIVLDVGWALLMTGWFSCRTAMSLRLKKPWSRLRSCLPQSQNCRANFSMYVIDVINVYETRWKSLMWCNVISLNLSWLS